MTTTSQKHTPTPWKSHIFDNVQKGRCFFITRKDGNKPILHIDSWEYNEHPERSFEEHEANAAFIVRAVNAHDALVEALTPLVEMVVDYKRGKIWDINYKGVQLAIDNACAALKLAKGED